MDEVLSCYHAIYLRQCEIHIQDSGDNMQAHDATSSKRSMASSTPGVSAEKPLHGLRCENAGIATRAKLMAYTFVVCGGVERIHMH